MRAALNPQYAVFSQGTSSGSGGLAETFAEYPPGVPWAQTGTVGAWYVNFLGNNGYVQPVQLSAGQQALELSASLQPSGTTSTLVSTIAETSGDVHYTVWMRVVSQHLPAPNYAPWNVPWFAWNYTIPGTGENRFYYVSLKTNGYSPPGTWVTGGFELGKVDQSIALPGGQRFLFTDSSAFQVGVWYLVDVQQTGAVITVKVDGVVRASFTDGPGSGGSPAWGTAGEIVMTSGSVGLYQEDSQVQFTSLSWV